MADAFLAAAKTWPVAGAPRDAARAGCSVSRTERRSTGCAARRRPSARPPLLALAARRLPDRAAAPRARRRDRGVAAGGAPGAVARGAGGAHAPHPARPLDPRGGAGGARPGSHRRAADRARQEDAARPRPIPAAAARGLGRARAECAGRALPRASPRGTTRARARSWSARPARGGRAAARRAARRGRRTAAGGTAEPAEGARLLALMHFHAARLPRAHRRARRSRAAAGPGPLALGPRRTSRAASCTWTTRPRVPR